MKKSAESEEFFLPFRQFFTQLQTVLSELPPEDRLLLEEKYILLLPDAEIAQILNIQPNSVRMRLILLFHKKQTTFYGIFLCHVAQKASHASFYALTGYQK